jgi:PKD repeat protein
MSHKFFRPLTSLIVALAIAFAGVTPAFAAPPVNDNFADAPEIIDLPFIGSVNNIEATTEPGEPFGCFSPRTVWYKFTPPASGFFTVNMNGSSFFDTILNVWRGVGSGLGGLNFMQCASFGGSLLLHLEGGTTYYFQAGDNFTGGGDLFLNLQEIPAPQPVANFSFFPGDPSQFDTVTFCSNAFDPGNVGIESFAWDFGDGATSTVNCAQHRYAADGDYTAQHQVTTFDGRNGSTTQVVSVRTHDVSIVKVSAPKSASVGQTRPITVAIKNTRYPETVRLDLYRSISGGGFELIASSMQFTPVRSGNRTTEFSFNYTFSPQDAQVGKVTFRVIVSLVNARDAFTADNEAFSTPPTLVPR